MATKEYLRDDSKVIMIDFIINCLVVDLYAESLDKLDSTVIGKSHVSTVIMEAIAKTIILSFITNLLFITDYYYYSKYYLIIMAITVVIVEITSYIVINLILYQVSLNLDMLDSTVVDKNPIFIDYFAIIIVTMTNSIFAFTKEVQFLLDCLKLKKELIKML